MDKTRGTIEIHLEELLKEVDLAKISSARERNCNGHNLTAISTIRLPV